jgi:hypothetical protein
MIRKISLTVSLLIFLGLFTYGLAGTEICHVCPIAGLEGVKALCSAKK